MLAVHPGDNKLEVLDWTPEVVNHENGCIEYVLCLLVILHSIRCKWRKTTQRHRRPEEVPFTSVIISFEIAPEEEDDFFLPVEVKNKLHDYKKISFN